MVKSVLGVNHRGLRDWLFQRVSAIVMSIYFLGMTTYFLWNTHLDYIDWHNLFTHVWMKVATIIFIFCLLYHTWVGMWTIVTDYIKFTSIALITHTLVFFTLVASFFWALAILWGI